MFAQTGSESGTAETGGSLSHSTSSLDRDEPLHQQQVGTKPGHLRTLFPCGIDNPLFSSLSNLRIKYIKLANASMDYLAQATVNGITILQNLGLGVWLEKLGKNLL